MIVVLFIGVIIFSSAHMMASLGASYDIEVLASYIVQIWAGWVSGNNFYFASKAAVGKRSAKRVFTLL